MWSSGHGEALIQGNFDEATALSIIDSIDEVLPFSPISSDDMPPQLEALPLPQSEAGELPPRLLIAEPNPSNGNSVAYVMIQSLGTSEKDHVVLELVGAIVTEPFYNELRTKQQLGYIVSSGVRAIGTTRTLGFIVQSSIVTADRLTVEILSFLDTVEKDLLQPLSNGDIAVYAKSGIDRKTEPDKDLSVEVMRNWGEIASGRIQFNRLQAEARALLDVTKDDILQLWNKVYSGTGRRALVTEIVPQVGVAASELPATSARYSSSRLEQENLILGIDDIEQFRRDREKKASLLTKEG
jgi:insulysin